MPLLAALWGIEIVMIVRLACAGFIGAALFTLVAPAVAAAGSPLANTSHMQAPDPYYKNCTEARAAGVTPILRGEPGYAAHLDRDNDGIACE